MKFWDWSCPISIHSTELEKCEADLFILLHSDEKKKAFENHTEAEMYALNQKKEKFEAQMKAQMQALGDHQWKVSDKMMYPVVWFFFLLFVRIRGK